MVEIIDVERLQRRRPQERLIEWRCSLQTRMRFRALLGRLLELEYESQRSPAVRQETWEVQEEIRALPDFPKRYDPDIDVIVPVTTTAMR